ncbi:MAG: SH3 domain-containing protein [Caldilineaceae bacterium]|nr:SH3 domain-containing protein [Caldilineaceae bacterium]
MFRRRIVGVGIAVVVLFVFGFSQLYAQSGLTLEGLSNRINTLSRRVSSLSNTRASNQELVALENRVATLEAKLGDTTPVAVATRRRPTSTPTRRPPTPTRVRPTATSTPVQPYIRITRNMNVRLGPDTTYAVVGYATIGQEFDITGRNADGSWWRIEFEGGDGWIYAPYVTAVNARGIRTVPTPVPPTATPVPPTATPFPPSKSTHEMDVGTAVQAILVSDYQFDDSALVNMTQSQKEHVATGYILLFEYVADYCGLSYGNTVQLLDNYAGELDAIRFTTLEGTKPRAFLMGYLYGFTRDTNPGTDSCNTALDLGLVAALSY